uniref:Nuclear pore complex protein NUP96 C-terminal domain-containing protein n=1 Tax=Spongospora subterranea TaxID=70186 RepID=A0A0H5R9Z4_9EUKA|eukprot:CRZ10497.1 hypothetical protein [Spongospora subterranea]
MSDQDHDDVFEFCLDDVIISNNQGTGFDQDILYPAIQKSVNSDAIQLQSSPSDKVELKMFDEAFGLFSESASVSPQLANRTSAAIPRPEALAAERRLDAVKLHAMRSAYEHETQLDKRSDVLQPQWMDSLPGPATVPIQNKAITEMSRIDLDVEEWGHERMVPPDRTHIPVMAPRSLQGSVYNPESLRLHSTEESPFSVGFGTGLRFVSRGRSLTSVRIMRINSSGINPRLVALHQNAVERHDNRADVVKSYKERDGDHWALIISLYDPDFSGSTVDMRNALSNWMEEAVRQPPSTAVSAELQHHVSESKRGFANDDAWSIIGRALMDHRLVDAVSASLKSKNPRLATLIAECGGGLRGQSRPLLREQIRNWSSSGTWQTFAEACQLVYRILAGDVYQLTADWLSNLSASFWFADNQNQSLQSLLAADADAPYDIRRLLMVSRVDPTMPAGKLFKGNAHWFDFAMMWHTYDIISFRGVKLHGHFPALLSMGYVAQLEGSGDFKSAIYIVLVNFKQNPESVEGLVQDILNRNWPASRSSRRRFDPVSFGYPESNESSAESQQEFTGLLSDAEQDIFNFVLRWTELTGASECINPVKVLYTAKYIRCLADGCLHDALTCALRAEMWDAAHSLFVTNIAPKLIIIEAYDVCTRIGIILASKQKHIPHQWKYGGQLILNIIHAVSSDCQDRSSLPPKGFLFQVPCNPRSSETVAKLRLLESAMHCVVWPDSKRVGQLTQMTTALLP